MSCHTFGSDMDCILCTISSSKGSDDWNNSPIKVTLDASDDVNILLGANGSIPPTGAN